MASFVGVYKVDQRRFFVFLSHIIYVILAQNLRFTKRSLLLPQLLFAVMCSLLVVVVWCRCDFWPSVTRQSPLFLASCSLPYQSDLQHEGIPGCTTCSTPNRTRNTQNTMTLLTDCEAQSACFIVHWCSSQHQTRQTSCPSFPTHNVNSLRLFPHPFGVAQLTRTTNGW